MASAFKGRPNRFTPSRVTTSASSDIMDRTTMKPFLMNPNTNKRFALEGNPLKHAKLDSDNPQDGELEPNGDPTHDSYSHINGSIDELLARLAVSEICKGWVIYLDNCEWRNFSSLFTLSATVTTSWSGTQSVADFMTMTRFEKDKGTCIHHKENGTLVELRSSTKRAVGKMKATISHRFKLVHSGDKDDIIFDVDCECRMLFFCLFDSNLGGWKAQYVKVIYEKDKVVPIDGGKVPHFKRSMLARFPQAYQYLGAAQTFMGFKVKRNLPVIREQAWFDLYYHDVEKWLDGEDVKENEDRSKTPQKLRSVSASIENLLSEKRSMASLASLEQAENLLSQRRSIVSLASLARDEDEDTDVTPKPSPPGSAM